MQKLNSKRSGLLVFIHIIQASLMAQMEKKSARNAGDLGLIPESGRSPGEENGYRLQYSCLEEFHEQRKLAGYSQWGHRVRHDWATHTHTLLRVSWTARKSNQSILKEINSEYSLEGLMLKFQYFGHLIWRVNSLEKTLMLGKTEGKRRRGRQRMRWLDCITNSMDMNVSKL